MSKFSIEISIEINAPVSEVWRVFTDSATTREIGGEYASDWEVGSSLGWKDLDGKVLTNGTIMKIEPEKLLQHTLLNSLGATGSVITYEFDEKNKVTTVYAQEDFTNPINGQEYEEAAEGWEAALRALKEIAERQKR